MRCNSALLAGGMFRADRPGLPFLAQDTERIGEGVQTVLAAAPDRLLFGQGKPASASSVRRRFGPVQPPPPLTGA